MSNTEPAPGYDATDEQVERIIEMRKALFEAIGPVLEGNDTRLSSAAITGVLVELLIHLNPNATDVNIARILASSVADAREMIRAGGSTLQVSLSDVPPK